MLLVEIAQLIEMARPAKICKDCGKSMAGHHYWYKGGWKCKKANRKDGAAEEKKPAAKAKSEAKKEAPAAKPQDDDDEKEHKGSVKGLEREAGEEKDEDVTKAEREEKAPNKKRQTGELISPAEMRDVTADSESAARKQVNDLFPKASAEAKARAMNVWKARNKKKD